jgi:hypothetical protein
MSSLDRILQAIFSCCIWCLALEVLVKSSDPVWYRPTRGEYVYVWQLGVMNRCCYNNTICVFLVLFPKLLCVHHFIVRHIALETCPIYPMKIGPSCTFTVFVCSKLLLKLFSFCRCCSVEYIAGYVGTMSILQADQPSCTWLLTTRP